MIIDVYHTDPQSLRAMRCTFDDGVKFLKCLFPFIGFVHSIVDKDLVTQVNNISLHLLSPYQYELLSVYCLGVFCRVMNLSERLTHIFGK